jgi:hypothetical protein
VGLGLACRVNLNVRNLKRGLANPQSHSLKEEL